MKKFVPIVAHVLAGLAVLVALGPDVVMAVRGESHPRIHVGEWTLILHVDKPAAIRTPGNSLYTFRPRVIGIVGWVYLFGWLVWIGVRHVPRSRPGFAPVVPGERTNCDEHAEKR